MSEAYLNEVRILRISKNSSFLFSWDGTLHYLTGKWWAVHTKPRNKKVFTWGLLRRHIGYFLPLLEHVKISGGKKRRTLLPLLTSYVFFLVTVKVATMPRLPTGLVKF